MKDKLQAVTHKECVVEKAHAKINLCLDAVSKRADGYHELRSVVVPLALHDRIVIEKADTMSYECNEPALPFHDGNTVVKAVRLMKEAFQLKDNYHISVTKQIPMEAGLGGGSSDAAAIMRGIAKLSKLSINDSVLEELGVSIGADVPCLVQNRCVFVSGIGEGLTFLTNRFAFPVLLVKPKAGASTKLVYENLNIETCPHPDVQKCLSEWENGNFKGVLANCGNSLEGSTFQLVSEVADLKQELLSYGFEFVAMSGSGTTVFAIGGMDVTKMHEISNRLKNRYPFVEVTSSYIPQ